MHDSGSEPAFRRNEAEHVYTIEAAHNPEVAGSNPAPATAKGAGNGAFRLESESIPAPAAGAQTSARKLAIETFARTPHEPQSRTIRSVIRASPLLTSSILTSPPAPLYFPVPPVIAKKYGSVLTSSWGP